MHKWDTHVCVFLKDICNIYNNMWYVKKLHYRFPKLLKYTISNLVKNFHNLALDYTMLYKNLKCAIFRSTV
jgi:hypothetical protein